MCSTNVCNTIGCEMFPTLRCNMDRLPCGWQVSLYKFIRLAGDLLPPPLYVPYIDMLIGLSSNPQSAHYCFDLLKVNGMAYGRSNLVMYSSSFNSNSLPYDYHLRSCKHCDLWCKGEGLLPCDLHCYTDICHLTLYIQSLIQTLLILLTCQNLIKQRLFWVFLPFSLCK